MASRSISRLRRFLRLSCLVAFAAIGLSSAFRSFAAEVEIYWAAHAPNAGQTLFHLKRAEVLWPYDPKTRTAGAYFWASTRFYEAAEFAVPDIEAALAAQNPFAADLQLALHDYREALRSKNAVAP